MMLTSPDAYHALEPSLNQIRVLNITSIHPLRCSFEYASLDDTSIEPYDAISWRWGDPSIRRDVEVDGKNISIPVNALEVLEHLCVAHRRFRVWIDAICINQEDRNERSQQVSIMSSIYARSQLTLVWLGQDDGMTERALESLDLVDNWRRIRHTRDGHIDCGVWCQQRVSDAFPMDTDWEAILSFFSPGWFLRFWIIQEVALSKHTHVFRGAHCVCWDFLAIVTHYLHLNFFQLATNIKTGVCGVVNAQSIARVASGAGAGLLLEESRSFEASDPRDRAFALYGLLGRDSECSTLRCAFVPDYDKSIREVYIDVTKAFIRHSPSQVALLLYAQRLVPRLDAPVDEEEFPSWVPRYDYIEDVRRGSYTRLSLSRTGPYADLDHKTRCNFTAPDHILRLAGVIVNDIAEIAGTILPSERGCPVAQHNMLVTLASFWEMITRLNASTPETELSAMLRSVLIAGSERSCGSSELYEHWDRDFRAFVNRFWSIPKPPNDLTESLSYANSDNDSDDGELEDDDWGIEGSDDDEGELEDMLDDDWSQPEEEEDEVKDDDKDNAYRFQHDMLDNIVNRPLFVASNGTPGTAARCAQVGDKICVLFGLPVPVLLRPLGNQYTLVGDVYLHDIMRGEFIQKLVAEGKLEESTLWFDLR